MQNNLQMNMHEHITKFQDKIEKKNVKIKSKIKNFLAKNPLLAKVISNYEFRSLVFAASGALVGLLFAIYYGYIGFTYHINWFLTYTIYYLVIISMKMGVAIVGFSERKETDTYKKLLLESRISCFLSCILLISAPVMGCFIILQNENEAVVKNGSILVITIAAYTFYKLTLAIMNIFTVKGLHSPLHTIYRRIGLCDALFSIYLLQLAMLVTWQSEELESLNFNTIVGSAIAFLVLVISIRSTILSFKELHVLKSAKKN